ncbi:uncharacterized protein BP5553_05892 [Venustampulla echinocandica]|uniref:Uncharacterized protein n=1 Tax=Venustampulla echinocandica TaxID=2656787 RepID=A0A370TLY7_9HELO|nr:uncharacterized protein BP5553_05892 [Venustampulla echinocandica]RDL36540.1 hypothetical protein BP5553_05892 [Venustampulla echinocandica]
MRSQPRFLSPSRKLQAAPRRSAARSDLPTTVRGGGATEVTKPPLSAWLYPRLTFTTKAKVLGTKYNLMKGNLNSPQISPIMTPADNMAGDPECGLCLQFAWDSACSLLRLVAAGDDLLAINIPSSTGLLVFAPGRFVGPKPLTPFRSFSGLVVTFKRYWNASGAYRGFQLLAKVRAFEIDGQDAQYGLPSGIEWARG